MCLFTLPTRKWLVSLGQRSECRDQGSAYGSFHGPCHLSLLTFHITQHVRCSSATKSLSQRTGCWGQGSTYGSFLCAAGHYLVSFPLGVYKFDVLQQREFGRSPIPGSKGWVLVSRVSVWVIRVLFRLSLLHFPFDCTSSMFSGNKGCPGDQRHRKPRPELRY